METIGSSEIWSFTDQGNRPEKITSNSQVRKSNGHYVENFIDLARKVSALQYKNPEYVLLFRGQAADYKNLQRNTTLKPSLFRPKRGDRKNPDQQTLALRFEALLEAEHTLIEGANRDSAFEDSKRILRHRILRWSLLQHYEVCPTPLLDVTHSLRIATSFGSESQSSEAFLYVMGVPNISGSITASAEAGLQVIRLSSVCPPHSVRPHIQEGYLLGEYPDLQDIKQKQAYDPYEVDFARRLIAKFRFSPAKFWSDSNFPSVSRSALYPDANDPFVAFMAPIKQRIDTMFSESIY